jgi:sulfide:quinone oxidoreductase
MVSGPAFEVLIAGGGVAALEAALALRDLAGERISLKLVAPNSEFVYRPMTVREPFSYGHTQRSTLREIAGDVGAELLEDSVARVDPPARTAHAKSGADLHYDGLMLCLGAQIRVRYEHAITLSDKGLDEVLHGLIQDVEQGYVKRLAFLIPGARSVAASDLRAGADDCHARV